MSRLIYSSCFWFGIFVFGCIWFDINCVCFGIFVFGLVYIFESSLI